MLSFLETQEHETIVIVDDIKRWARDVRTHFDLKTEIYRRGGRLESPSFRFEDTPEGEFVEVIMAAQAQLERKQNRRQVLNRMKARMEQGYWAFHTPPGLKYAFHPVHKRIVVIDRKRAVLAREMLEGFAHGRFESAAEAYRFLRDAGYFNEMQSRRQTNHIMVVHRMLRSILYTGYLEFKPWGITLRKGHHPAIISLDTYQVIQEKLRGRNRPLVRVDTREDFPLRNLVACAGCGHKLTASFSRGKRRSYPYYHCYSRECPLYGKVTAKAELEASFEALLQRLEATDSVIELARLIALEKWEEHIAQRKQAAATLEKRRSEIADELERLGERIGRTESDVVFRTLEQRIEQLVYEQNALDQKAATAAEPAAEFGTQFDRVRDRLKSPYAVWKTGDLETKRRLARMVFAGPLPYDRETGFGTPAVTLPFLVVKRLAGQKSDMVDQPLKTWKPPAQKTPDLVAQPWTEFIRTIMDWADSIGPNDCADATGKTSASSDS
jgi:hypothetical protein